MGPKRCSAGLAYAHSSAFNPFDENTKIGNNICAQGVGQGATFSTANPPSTWVGSEPFFTQEVESDVREPGALIS